MAQRALGAGMAVPRRRALFGLLDADGWAWASVKAFIWLVIIIFMLGYLPDRAYYFTVGADRRPRRARLVADQLLPADQPDAAVPAAGRLRRPVRAVAVRARAPGAANRRLGHPGRDPDLLLRRLGREDRRSRASTSPRRSDRQLRQVADPGPICRRRGASASVAYVQGSIYVIGGNGADGKATKTVFVLSPDPQTGVARRVADGRQPGPARGARPRRRSRSRPTDCCSSAAGMPPASRSSRP